MSVPETFTVSKNCKLNNGNYESTDFFMSATYSLDDGDNLHEQIDEAHVLMNQAMTDALYNALKTKKEKTVSRDKIVCRWGLTNL